MTNNDFKMCWVLNTLMLNLGTTIEENSEKIDLEIISKENKSVFDELCKENNKEPIEMFLELCDFACSDYSKNHFKKMGVIK